jgi:hypothetical protein
LLEKLISFELPVDSREKRGTVFVLRLECPV